LCRLLVEDEWLESTLDRAFLSMEVLCGLARWSNGGIIGDWVGEIRGKWRIVDGKEREWSDLVFRAPRW
jgi:hypothetical protein